MKSRIQIFLALLVMFHATLLIGGQWQAGVPMNTPRQGAAAVVIDDYIYVMGGKSLNNTVLNTVERFNLNTGVWETNIASFSTPRVNAAAIVFNNKIFLSGGRDHSDDVIDEVEVYDPVQNSWQSAHDMREDREGHTLAFFNNRIYAIGGQDENSFEEEIEWYDESNDNWKEAAFEIAYPRAAFFSGVISDTFYMCGGFYYGPTKNSAVKPPLTLNWYDGPDMAAPRADGASAVLGDSLFMIGGETFSGVTDSVEIYDPKNWQIIPGVNLPVARRGMTAVTLNNKIYVIGGVTAQSGGQPTTSVEVYSTGPVGIPLDDSNQLIQTAHLVGYPNPFNGRINLQFQIPQRSHIELAVFDLQGRIITTLVHENLTEGTHQVSWAGEDSQNRQVASGIYFAMLKGDRFHKTFKIFYVK